MDCNEVAPMLTRRTTRHLDPDLIGRVREQVERCGCSARHTQVEEFLHTAEFEAREALRWSQIEREGAVERSDIPFGGVAGRRGERKVDSSAMWRIMTYNMYHDSDFIALATRETLQNSVDAIRASVRSRDPKLHIEQGTGYFAVEWSLDENGNGTLSFEDNGIGMDERTLEDKFLTLGASGKEGDTEAAGGFGAAKAVILGVTPTDRWEIHTRDVGARSLPKTHGQDIFTGLPRRQGTKLVLYDIPADDMYSRVFAGKLYTPEERIRMMLEFSDLPDIRVLFNNTPVESTFPRRKGSAFPKYSSGEKNWGHGNDVQVKSYRRALGTGGGSYYIRLNGLVQFVRKPNTKIPSDLVFDMKTTLRPDDRAYPLSASRDGFKSYAYSAFEDVRGAYEEEASAEDKPKAQDFETLLPSAEGQEEQKGAAEFEDALREATEDPDLLTMMTGLAGVAADFLNEQAKYGQSDTRGTRRAHGADDQPEHTGAPASETGSGSSFADFRDQQAATPSTEEVGTSEGRQRLGDVVSDAIKDARPGAGETWWTESTVADAVRKLKAGEDIDPQEAVALLDALKGSTEQQAQQPGESTMTVVVTAAELSKLVAAAASANPASSAQDKAQVTAKARAINPFGGAAIVKISNKNYDLAEVGVTVVATERQAKWYLHSETGKQFVQQTVSRFDGKVDPNQGGQHGIRVDLPPDRLALFRAAVEEKDLTLQNVRHGADRTRSRKFLKNTKKYVPHLVVWDMALRLIAEEGNKGKANIPPFQPGFVLDDSVRAMASNEGEAGTRSFRRYVMVHPDFFEATVKAHKERPHAIAAYIHHIAVHELAHLPLMGKGHGPKGHNHYGDRDAPSDDFIVAREDLGVATGHLLPAIEQIVIKAFKLDPPKSTLTKAQLKAAEKKGREEATARLQERVQAAERRAADLPPCQEENARLRAIVDTGRGRLHDTIRRLEGLIEYDAFRLYLTGPGAAFLPPGISARKLLEVVDQYPEIAVDVLLGTEAAP